MNKRFKVVVLLLTVLMFVGCETKPLEDNSKKQEDEQAIENNSNNEKAKAEFSYEDAKKVIDECVNHYYEREVEGLVVFEEKSFIIYSVIDKAGETYYTPIQFIQYKDDINKVYHNHDLIWENSKPVGNKTEFGGGYPYMLQIMDGPIRIRKEHNTDSETIGEVNTGEYYHYFDKYEDDNYIWYWIYISETDSYGWIAGSKTEYWIGLLL